MQTNTIHYWAKGHLDSISYQTNNSILILGDFLELCVTLKDSAIDLVICDPPYFRIKGGFDFEFKSLDDYLVWMKKVTKEIYRVCKPTASVYLWGAIGVNTGWQLFKIVDWIEKENLFSIINWITQRNTRGYGNKRGYMMAREEVVFMTKSENYTWNGAYTEEKSNRKDLGANGKPRTNEFKRCSDVWIDITEASQSANQRFLLPSGESFPTVKALKLCERIIKASSNSKDTILIPFAGSGSECLACVGLDREFIAFEKEQDHFELTKRRLKETL